MRFLHFSFSCENDGHGLCAIASRAWDNSKVMKRPDFAGPA
jgi:hypothetical protein